MTSGQLQQINKVKGKTRFSHLRETNQITRGSTADRDRREGEAKERGRGPKEREPHTEGKKRGNTPLQRSDSERQGQRRDRELSSLTDAQ